MVVKIFVAFALLVAGSLIWILCALSPKVELTTVPCEQVILFRQINDSSYFVRLKGGQNNAPFSIRAELDCIGMLRIRTDSLQSTFVPEKTQAELLVGLREVKKRGAKGAKCTDNSFQISY